MQNKSIGIFDSGVGGLCVLKEIRDLLPNESLCYLADNHNCPYGSKSETEAFELARKSIEFLLKQDCKMIVIACNTVTAVAIDQFRSDYPVPFIGMEPAIKPAARRTRSKKIGVLATENTFKGRLFNQTSEKYAKGIEVFVQPGHGLVELVENGEQESLEARTLLEAYLMPMVDMGADTLVLGCTHYPYLSRIIQQITNNRMTIIDPANAVAEQTRRVLEISGLICPGEKEPGYSFYVTGDVHRADRLLSKTMGRSYGIEQVRI